MLTDILATALPPFAEQSLGPVENEACGFGARRCRAVDISAGFAEEAHRCQHPAGN